jgi:hypothetical protein
MKANEGWKTKIKAVLSTRDVSSELWIPPSTFEAIIIIHKESPCYFDIFDKSRGFSQILSPAFFRHSLSNHALKSLTFSELIPPLKHFIRVDAWAHTQT